MKTRRYYGYLYVISYLLLLRIVLVITTDVGIFNFGIIFDVFLVMFWTGALAIFMKNQVIQKIWYIFVVLIGTVFAVGDSIYHDYFETLFSRKSFQGLKWLTEGQTLEYDIHIPIVAYFVTPILIAVIYLIITNKKKDVFYLRDFAILSMVFVVQVILFITWGSYEYDTRYEYYRSDAYLFESMYDRERFSEKYGYYNYHLLDLTRIRSALDVDEVIQEVEAYYDEKESHQFNSMSNRYEGYNVITLLGETLDTRFIDPVLTPNLYMMKTNGIHHSNYFTPVFQQGATCNSEYMSLNGMHAITTNDWSNNICDAYTTNTFAYSMPNQLSEAGYTTYYFHSGHEWFYNRQNIIPNYGFDHVKFQEDLYEAGYDDFNEKFDTNIMYFFDEYVDYSEPFMVNILNYSMHGAYNQVEFDKYRDIVEAAHDTTEMDPEVINYMEKLVEFDMFLGLLLDELEIQGVLDQTIIAIYPDHYPYMMNTKTYTDYVGIEADDLEIMRQDFIIYATDMTGSTNDTPGSTLDVAPTLLNMVYFDANFDYFQGTDLFAEEDNFVLFSDLTITDGTNFLYINTTLFGEEETYPYLEAALEEEITAFELQKKMLEIDYFKIRTD